MKRKIKRQLSRYNSLSLEEYREEQTKYVDRPRICFWKSEGFGGH